MDDLLDLPEDPFLKNLYDAPGVAVWRHNGQPGGTYYELDLAGHTFAADVLKAALLTVPSGALLAVTGTEPHSTGLID